MIDTDNTGVLGAWHMPPVDSDLAMAVGHGARALYARIGTENRAGRARACPRDGKGMARQRLHHRHKPTPC